MNEINYQIFDQCSNLPIITLTDAAVRTIAAEKNQTLSETFFALKKEVEEMGVKYSINILTNTIKVLPKNSFFLDKKTLFFDTYAEALAALKEFE